MVPVLWVVRSWLASTGALLYARHTWFACCWGVVVADWAAAVAASEETVARSDHNELRRNTGCDPNLYTTCVTHGLIHD